MSNRFDFYYDSGLCGLEPEMSYEKFIKFLEQAIDHYNTEEYYVDENGQVYHHIYQEENGTLITMEHFKPNLFLFDKETGRLIKLSIDGYDHAKTFNIEFFDTSFQSLMDYFGDEIVIVEKKIFSLFNFQTQNVALVKYCYKLVFEDANVNELNQLLNSVENIKQEQWVDMDIQNIQK